MKTTLLRILAVFGYSSLSVIAGAAFMGIAPLKAALLAGIVATAQVVEKLARAYADDGKISKAELSDAFGSKANPQ